MIKIEFERMDEKIMEYQLVKIRTVFTEDDIESGLSFLEAEQDIPFKINVYIVFMKEKINRRDFIYTNIVGSFCFVHME